MYACVHNTLNCTRLLVCFVNFIGIYDGEQRSIFVVCLCWAHHQVTKTQLNSVWALTKLMALTNLYFRRMPLLAHQVAKTKTKLNSMRKSVRTGHASSGH